MSSAPDSPASVPPPLGSWAWLKAILSERPAQIMGSAFLLIMVWGLHGNLALLTSVWPAYEGPGSNPATRPRLIPGVPFDNELISFVAGFGLLVVIPILLIKLAYKEPLTRYGLGLPPRGRRLFALVSCVGLIVVFGPIFIFGARGTSMEQVYPLYRGDLRAPGMFLAYELTYGLFFVVIEFIFRGYLLFGLYERKGDGPAGRYDLGQVALFIQMLPYTAWHLGKPLPELWGTPLWGLLVGYLSLRVRSIWPVMIAHYLLNVLIDAAIVYWPR